MSQASPSEGREFAWMWLAIRKHIAKIVLIMLIACAIAVVYVLTRTKEYTAYTEILIGPNPTEFGNLEEDNNFVPDSVGPAELESEIRLIGSSRVISKVIDDLDLSVDDTTTPSILSTALNWFGVSPASSHDGRLDGVDLTKRLDAFREKLSIERDPLAFVVSVGYTSPDREKAALIANTLARTYLDDRIEAKRKALTETAENLRRSVDDMASWLKSQEREIEDFRADSDLYAVSGTSPAEQRYNTLAERLTEAKLELTNAQSRYSQADGAVRRGKALDSIREVQTSPVINTLRGQETEIQRSLADLATRFGVNHPIMTNTKAELGDVQESIQREVDRIVDQLQLEVTVAENRVKTIKEQVDAAQSELANSQTTRIRLKELERDAEAPRRVYETMLERYQRAREQEKLLLDSARIIGPANIPNKPSNVSGLLLLGFTAAGSFAAGIGLAFLLEVRRPGYTNAAELEQDLGHPVLALVPAVHRSGSAKRSTRWEVLEAYGLTEAIRSLVYAVLPKADRHERDSAKVLVVTSSFPDEGKSTISLSLARQAAFSDLKTLLIEGDLRKPGMREGMTTIDPKVGLADILRGEVNYADDAIVTEPESGVDIMLGFGPADDSFSLMRGERMAQLLTAVRPRYDLIIIDAAPIMAVSETRSLVDLADESLFVIRWKTTERSAARTALRDLERMGAKICGVILNRVDLREHLKYADADRLAYQDKYNQYAAGYTSNALKK